MLASRSQEHVRHTKMPLLLQLQQGAVISGLQSFAYLQAPVLARPSGCTHHVSGRPGLTHHAFPQWLPCSGCGIATCPTRAIHMTGLSPVRLWPCRPLLPHPALQLNSPYTRPRKLMCYSRSGQRIMFEVFREVNPVHFPFLAAPVEPFMNQFDCHPVKRRYFVGVSADAVILEVTPQLRREGLPPFFLL